MGKSLADGDHMTDEEWVREFRRAEQETRLRAAKLPGKQRQRIPVIKAPTDIDARLDAHFEKFAPAIDAINAGFAATGAKKP